MLNKFVLLLVIGFLIYKLMQPSAIKNSGSVDNSVNNNESTATTNNNNNNVEQLSDTETNTFLGNLDEEGGAKLEEAYNKPISEGTSTTTVDFNKNILEKYDVEDYLPQEVNQEWFDYDNNNVNAGTDTMINTDRYVIGVNTVGQSLRNASYDLRTAPPNPKFTTGPWNNSTIEADHNIKPLC